jgi:hypothetical protein
MPQLSPFPWLPLTYVYILYAFIPHPPMRVIRSTKLILKYFTLVISYDNCNCEDIPYVTFLSPSVNFFKSKYSPLSSEQGPCLTLIRDNKYNCKEFEVTMEVTIWIVTPCTYERFREKPAQLAAFLLGILFDHEDGGDLFFRNIWLPPYMALKPTSPHSSTQILIL